MKTHIRALSMFLAVCGIGLAGSEESTAGERTRVAPTPDAYPSWTGFYVGGLTGYKYGITDPSISLSGTWLPGDASEVESRGDKKLDSSGAELGGLIGYNHQWSHWVVGLEATGSYVWLDGSNSTGDFRGPTTNQFFLWSSFESHYLVTVGPRIGHAICDWLPYVTGGMAIGDLEFSQRLIAADYFGTPLSGRKSRTNVGWFVGGGLQYAITNHLSARVQCEYLDLGHISFDTTLNPAFPVRNKFDLVEHNANFAIIYQF
jgi:outer membrane immunogenic protein